MSSYLWPLAQYKEVCDAVRAQTGKTGQLKMSELPAEIASIASGSAAETWKECWLEKPKATPQTVFIDTGIAAAFDDEIEVTCRCSIGSMSACFNAAGSSGTRMGMNFLPNNNRAQVFWGGYADTNITIDRAALDVTNTTVVTQNAAGVSIAGFNSNGVAATWENTYTATGNAAPSQPYRLFVYDRNKDIHYGLFRKAIVRKDAGSVVYTIVPEVSNNFTARLKITRRLISDTETVSYVAVPAGFLCHVDNEAAV